jgi:hypothetical protein
LWNLICNDYEQAEGVKELFFQLLDKLNNEDIITFSAVLWCLWKRPRNDIVWKSTEKPVRLALHEANSLVMSWQHRNILDLQSGISQHRNTTAAVADQHRWSLPAPDCVECNIDTAWFEPNS